MKAILTTSKAVCVAILAAALASNVGCAKMSWKPSKMFSLDNTWPFRDKDKPREGTPERMVCTWSDTVMTKAGEKPQRGFGGRIMFYEKDEKDPIVVDGQLVVYAFDETDRDPTDNKPTRRYVFPSEQIPLHMSKSELGASYSFWLPWDEAGGPRTIVGLICRFEPKGGAVVTSEQAKHTLPGTEPSLTKTTGPRKPPKLPDGVPAKPQIETLESLQAKRRQERTAQQASYESPVNPNQETPVPGTTSDVQAMPTRHMSSTTINLPNNFQMPTAATLMNQSLPPARSAQSPAQAYQQAMPAQPPVQQPAPAANATFPPNIPSVGNQQTWAGTGMQPSSMQLGPTGTIMPGAPQLGQPLANFNQSPNGQTPMAQQAANNTKLQQLLAEQRKLQQEIAQAQATYQQSPGQVPVMASTPAGGQYR